MYPGLHPEPHELQERERILPLCSTVKIHPEHCIQLWGPQYMKNMDLPEQVQRRPQRGSEGWSISAMKTGLRELGLSSLEKRCLWENYSTF